MTPKNIFAASTCLVLLSACGGNDTADMMQMDTPGDPIFADASVNPAIYTSASPAAIGTFTAFSIANDSLDRATDVPAGNVIYAGGMTLAETDAGGPVAYYNGNLTLDFGFDPARQFFSGSWTNLTGRTAAGAPLGVAAGTVFQISGDYGDAVNTSFGSPGPSPIDGDIVGDLIVDGVPKGIAGALVGTFAGNDSGTALGLVDGFLGSNGLEGVFILEQD